MSEDQDKDFSKQRPKKPVRDNRGAGPPNMDYKDKKTRPNKDYQVYYDPKYDKPRDQSGPNKGNYSPAYDDYNSKSTRNDNYNSYRPKPHNPRQKRTGQEHIPNVWRKKTSKISRDSILETFSRVEKHNEIEDWLSNYKELFVPERQQPVNEEVFQLDPNEGLIAKTNTRAPGGPGNYKDNEGQSENKGEAESSGANTTGTATTGNKDREMFDFGQERFDPIMDMRRRQKQGQGKEESKSKKEDQWDELLEGDGTVKGLPKNQFGDEELGGHEELEQRDKDFGGLEDGDAGQYSDIDAMFEKKLKNNEIQETFEDAFEDLVVTNGKRAQLVQMENNERPEWEDVDTRKVIEDIKKEDFLANLPQDKGAIFGQDYLGREIPRATTTRSQPIGFAQSGGFLDELRGDSTKHASDIDFSSINFGTDLKLGQDDFGFNPEDLFPSTFDSGISSKTTGGFPLSEGANPGFLGQPGFSHPMMQQGNMSRPMQNAQLVNPVHQLHQFQQFQHMQQMQGMPLQQIGPMGQQQAIDPMNPMHQMGGPRFAGPSGQFPNMPTRQAYPPYKSDPSKEAMAGGPGGPAFPRQQINPTYPSFIFKYFSPNYEEKLWYYIDLQKRVQGPFTGKTMDEWYANGHLPLTLNVTIGRNSGYKNIKDLADLIVNRTIQGDPTFGPEAPNKPQSQAGFSGINDLLKNRPDLAQYGQGAQGAGGNKAKGIDEVEKGGVYQQQPPFNQYQRYQNYQERDRDGGDYSHQNYRGQGRNYGNDYYEGQGGYQKRGGYQTNEGGPRDINADSPNRSADSQNKSTNQTTSPSGSNVSGDHNKADKSKEQSTPSAGGVNLGALGGLQNNTDIASQLKNMLGLGGLGGLAGLGALGGLGGAVPTEPVTQKPAQQVENKAENVQQALFQHNTSVPREERANYNKNYHHQEKQERQERPEKHERVEKQEKVEKVEKQQQQAQRKGSKAPKIDTSDFPSLTETYK